MKLDFGVPLGGIVQYAYVVEDIERSMADFTARLGIGPWFLRDHFTPPEGRLRGKPTGGVFSLARAFSGHAMVELIQQHDESPSVFHEDPGPRSYGFHHWAVFTADFDGDVERYLALGWEQAFYDRLPSGSRVTYMDPRGELPGMLELIEHSDAQERVYTNIYLASLGWDGGDPVRKEG
jgi:glyoxalase/bleomycin resistance protein/dioxygenase superfamily protein